MDDGGGGKKKGGVGFLGIVISHTSLLISDLLAVCGCLNR